MRTALRETWKIILRTLPWAVLYEAVIILILPGIRTYVFENFWYCLSGILEVLALFYVLIFAAQLVLVWVRAEKKEEDKV